MGKLLAAAVIQAQTIGHRRENSKAFVNKQSNEIRELLIMLYNITDILIISTCVSQCSCIESYLPFMYIFRYNGVVINF